MNMTMLYLTIMFALVHIVASILITHEVSKRGVEINIPWLRVMILKYAHQYRQMTLAETGSVGALFYWWIVSINLALASFIAAFLV